MQNNNGYLPAIPPELGDWINQQLPSEAVWEVRPVDARNPPFRIIAYDVIVTGDRPPTAARARTLEAACRSAVRRYLRSGEKASPNHYVQEATHGIA